MRRVQIRHSNRHAEGRAQATTGDPTDFPAVPAHHHALPSCASPGQTQPGERSPRPPTGDLSQRLLTDERARVVRLALVELDSKGEPRGQRIEVLRELMAIQRHRRFHTQRVASPQPRRTDHGVKSPEKIDEIAGSHGRHNHLGAVLTRVAGPRDHDPGAQQVPGQAAIPLQRSNLTSDRREGVDDLGSLQGEHQGVKRLVAKIKVQLAAHLINVLQELYPIGGVADHQVPLGRKPVHQGVVPAPPIVIAHQRVAALTLGHGGDRASAKSLENAPGIGAGERQPPHVRDIKDSPAPAHLEVLLDDRAVEHRHLPAGKLDHPGPMSEVILIERRPTERRWLHRVGARGSGFSVLANGLGSLSSRSSRLTLSASP